MIHLEVNDLIAGLVKQHSQERFISDLKERLRHTTGNSIPGFDCYQSTVFARKWRSSGQKCEIVGVLMPALVAEQNGAKADHPIFFLLNYLPIGDPHRIKKLKDKAFRKALIEEASQLCRNANYSCTDIHQKPADDCHDPLPAEYTAWLYPPNWERTEESGLLNLVVYETRGWTKRFCEKHDHWKAIHERLRLFHYDDLSCTRDIPGTGKAIRLLPLENISVLAVYCNCRDSETRILLLVNIYDANDFGEPRVETEWALDCVQTQIPIVKDFSRIVSEQQSMSVKRCAIRAYPGQYLEIENYNFWKSIVGQEGGNLALSPEEEECLKRLATQNNQMPVFINGGAGSGKSTVLFYLFAHYWVHKRVNRIQGSPIYLTLNRRLVELARDTVRDIVESDSRYISLSRPDVTQGLENAFLPFRDVLLSLIPVKSQSEFLFENEVTFSEFQKLFAGESNGGITTRLESWCTPALAWHIIRSYIQGYTDNGYLSPSDYLSLPTGDRSVTDRAFEYVYNRVWVPWYSVLLNSTNKWDQQSLARKVLALSGQEQSSPPRQYAAVFCDEAQDLTGIEMKIVRQLSLFSAYDLSKTGVHGIPFAFAGDPFQTLNPSGFRWENLTSNFWREIVYPMLLRTGSHAVHINRVSLKHNYRSPRCITMLANSVQLWRQRLFQDREVSPQEPYSCDEGVGPFKWIMTDDTLPSDSSQYEGMFFLVPADEGQEGEYIKTDPFLTILSNSDKAPEIMTIADAKGLNLKRVVAYKLGSLFDVPLDTALAEVTNIDDELELSYKLNKLYVAVTRATDDLLIIDSQQGDNALWRVVCDSSKLQELLADLGDAAEDWKDLIPLDRDLLDTPDHIGSTLAPLSPEEMVDQAHQLMAAGLSQQNASLLRRAKRFFGKGKDTANEKLCDAHRLRIEKKYRDAAELYCQLSRYRERAECLWEGTLWQQYDQLREQTPRGLAARLMISKEATTEDLSAFAEFLLKGGLEERPIPSSQQWAAIVRKAEESMTCLLKDHFNHDASIADSTLWLYASLCGVLCDLGFASLVTVRIRLLTALGMWQEAKRVLVDANCRLDRIPDALRHEVDSHVLGWPDVLRPLHKLNKRDEMVAEWAKHNRSFKGIAYADFSQELNAVYEALLASAQEYGGEAVQDALAIVNEYDMGAQLSRSLLNGRISKLRMVSDLFRPLVEARAWRGILYLVENLALDPEPEILHQFLHEMNRAIEADVHLEPDARNVQIDLRLIGRRLLRLMPERPIDTDTSLCFELGHFCELARSYDLLGKYSDSFADCSRADLRFLGRQAYVMSARMKIRFAALRAHDQRDNSSVTELAQRLEQWNLPADYDPSRLGLPTEPSRSLPIEEASWGTISVIGKEVFFDSDNSDCQVSVFLGEAGSYSKATFTVGLGSRKTRVVYDSKEGYFLTSHNQKLQMGTTWSDSPVPNRPDLSVRFESERDRSANCWRIRMTMHDRAPLEVTLQ